MIALLEDSAYGISFDCPLFALLIGRVLVESVICYFFLTGGSRMAKVGPIPSSASTHPSPRRHTSQN